MYPRVVIAGERSGCGKTAVSLALMNALSRRGLRVQGFKTGPDYIDPSHYESRTGLGGRNIDLWMTKPYHVLELFCHNASRADISVIEGVMGLYDGAYPDNTASTAHTAKFLGAPVILVLNGRGGSQTAAAAALGLKMFDADINIAGFVLNRVFSKARAHTVARTVTEKTGIRFLGFIPEEDEIAVASRHLGLMHAAEVPVCAKTLSTEADIVLKSLDVERIEKIARSAPPLVSSPLGGNSLFPSTRRPQTVRLAVARDRAFSFYYEDTLELLSLWGCEIAAFSPLREERLPEGTDAVFIGGGFPELYCEELEGNASMRSHLRSFALAGGAVYAECGGMMYLGGVLKNLKGRGFEMCGVLPVDFEMRPRLHSLGYREIVAGGNAGFFRSGDNEKGHEFHYSKLADGCSEPGFFEITKSAGGSFRGGVCFRNTVASYIHLNLLSSGMVKIIPERVQSLARAAV